MTAEQFAELGIVGKGAMIVFVLAWIYAVVSALALMPHNERFKQLGMGVWQDAVLRPKFVRFVGFCALGVLAGVIGFTFGGWPTS
jgi:hypothetical protein